MRIDRYTKAVLTVIALCLVWMSLGGPSTLPELRAQGTPATVYIAGWQDANGELWKLPVTEVARPTGVFPDERHVRSFEAAQRRGARLPVNSQ